MNGRTDERTFIFTFWPYTIHNTILPSTIVIFPITIPYSEWQIIFFARRNKKNLGVMSKNFLKTILVMNFVLFFYANKCLKIKVLPADYFITHNMLIATLKISPYQMQRPCSVENKILIAWLPDESKTPCSDDSLKKFCNLKNKTNEGKRLRKQVSSMLTAYLALQVLTYMYTYTCWVSSKHLATAYCLPLLPSAYVYVYVYLVGKQ